MTDPARDAPKTTLDLSPQSLLTLSWTVLGTLTQIIGVASLVQDLVAWGPFIRGMIAAYRHLVDALWGPLLGLLPLDLPRWTHDWLTITGLMSLSVLWSLHQTSKTYGWGGLGSVLGVMRHTFLDFSIGGNALALFAGNARLALAEQGLLEPADETRIDHLARRPGRLKPTLLGLLVLILALAALVVFPLAIPALMYLADHLDGAQFQAVLKARIAEADKTLTDPARHALIRAELDRTVSNCDVRDATNALYYRTILKELGLYYLFVMVGFGLLVFANFAMSALPTAVKG
jgi:hypothetical protein